MLVGYKDTSYRCFVALESFLCLISCVVNIVLSYFERVSVLFIYLPVLERGACMSCSRSLLLIRPVPIQRHFRPCWKASRRMVKCDCVVSVLISHYDQF